MPWLYKGVIGACLLALLVVAGFGVYSWFKGPKVEIVVKDNVKTVYVDRPVITTKEVIKYVTDRAEVEKVLMENAYLQNQVVTLNETIAQLKTSGSGKVIYRDVPGPTKVVHETEFKDWRLHFLAQDESATYTLTQSFEAIATAGRDKEGKPFSSVKLFEIGPAGERFPMTNTQTTVVAATPGGKGWFPGVNIQAGAGITTDQGAVVVGVRWLTRGYSKAAEDGVYSILTPVAFIGSKDKEVGILPISLNLGRLPHQPFKDLWLSPYVSSKRVGVAILATF